MYLRHEHKKDINKLQFPILKVSETFKDEKWLVGESEILEFFIFHKMMNLEFLNDHSEYTKEGVRFIEDQIQPIIDEIFDYPVLKWQTTFRPSMNEFSKGHRNIPAFRSFFNNFSQSIKQVVAGLSRNAKRSRIQYFNSESEQNDNFLMENVQLYNSVQIDFMNNLKVFFERFGSNDFHGGDDPDSADLTLFSMISAHDNSRSWQNFIDHAFHGKVLKWYIQMQQFCKYREERGDVLGLKNHLDNKI
jgi:hypothetical protein